MQNSRNQIIKHVRQLPCGGPAPIAYVAFQASSQLTYLTSSWEPAGGDLQGTLLFFTHETFQRKCRTLLGRSAGVEGGFTRMSGGKRAEYGSLCCLLKRAPGTLTLQATCRPDLEDYCLWWDEWPQPPDIWENPGSEHARLKEEILSSAAQLIWIVFIKTLQPFTTANKCQRHSKTGSDDVLWCHARLHLWPRGACL